MGGHLYRNIRARYEQKNSKIGCNAKNTDIKLTLCDNALQLLPRLQYTIDRLP